MDPWPSGFVGPEFLRVSSPGCPVYEIIAKGYVIGMLKLYLVRQRRARCGSRELSIGHKLHRRTSFDPLIHFRQVSRLQGPIRSYVLFYVMSDV